MKFVQCTDVAIPLLGPLPSSITPAIRWIGVRFGNARVGCARASVGVCACKVPAAGRKAKKEAIANTRNIFLTAILPGY